MTRRAVLLILGVVVALLGGALALVIINSDDEPQESPAATIDAFLASWEQGDTAAMARIVLGRPRNFGARHKRIVEGLGKGHSFEMERGTIQQAEEDAKTAAAPFEATVAVPGLGDWTYESRLNLVYEDDAWWVDWHPRTVHPVLKPGLRLRSMRIFPPRGAITDHNGKVLAGPQEVVEIGIEPQRVTNLDALAQDLKRELDVDPAEVKAKVNAPGVQPDWFVVVAQVSEDEYQRVRPAIYPLPGTVFRRTTARAAGRGVLAQQIIGRTGEITAEILKEEKGRYLLGDTVGLSGLERALDDELAGRPDGQVQVVNGEGELVEVLQRFAGVRAQKVRTTLDLAMQRAAEEALSDVKKSVALVAVHAPTGGIRATVSKPLGEFNRALSGRYPPGSTFKIVTAAAALQDGMKLDSSVSCPRETEVGGRTFNNAGGETLGRTNLLQAFAHSCNTVFGPLGADLDRDVFEKAARTLGFNRDYSLPIGSVGGSFPDLKDDTEAAAAGIGQARVTASPLHMATVAAAVAAGAWRPPSLIDDANRPKATKLPAKVVNGLRRMMREVVLTGTGTAADVPGKEVAGKTGTAEFGGGDPPKTHAWFVGYAGDVAVAVIVEDGGFGGAVAAPLFRRFVGAL